MHPRLHPAVEALEPIGLDELNAAAGLLNRVDRKYVLGCASLAAVLRQLGPLYRALEIDGAREFGYESTYFDTPDLMTYRDHVKGRRRRFKVRGREYLHSGEVAFEVKLKGARGRTVKRRASCVPSLDDRLSEAAAAFLADCLATEYDAPPPPPMLTTLTMRFLRTTLVAPELGERVTIDTGLVFRGPDGRLGRMVDDVAIVESKSARGSAVIDGALRRAGARPERACSKYCVGLALVRPDVRANSWRPLLRRYFEPEGAAAAA